MLVDLTHPLGPATPLGGPLPPVEVRQVWRLGDDIANISQVCTVTHAGTHLDAPQHFIEDGRVLSDIPLEWLCGDGSVVEVPCDEHQEITSDDLDRRGGHVRKGDRLLVRTGFTDRYGDESYHRNPFLGPDAVDWLLTRGVRLVAFDLMTPERPRTVRDANGFGFPTHHALLGADVLIVENAAIPSGLPARLQLHVLPLALTVGDGAPARIVGRT